MDSKHIDRINYSWDIVAEHPGAMLSFYDKLFEVAPQVKHYFPNDLTKQSEKLAYTVGFVVGNLERLNEIEEAIQDLGRFHNRLKIKPEYYVVVKDTLIATIKDIMGARFSEDIRIAWDLALSTVAEIMINAPEKRENRMKKLIGKLFGRS